MRRTKYNNSEKGQIIVIIAFMVIAMIAMLGLTIDAGGLFFLRRDAQNAVDHSIVAAVYAQCAGGGPAQVEKAARDAAGEHGFETDGDGTTVNVNTNKMIDSKKYIEVTITADKDPYFIHIVYSGDLQVTTRAVGKCNPDLVSAHITAVTGLGDCTNDVSINAGGGQALEENHDHRGPNLELDGDQGTHIFNGSAYSNSKLVANSGAHTHPPGIPAEYVNSPSPSGFDGGTYVGPEPIVFPYLYDIDDYDKFSSDHPIAQLAMDQNRYHYYGGDAVITDVTDFDGLIYAEGNIEIDHGSGNSAWPNQEFEVTLVSRNGNIQFTNAGGNNRKYSYRSYTESLGVGDYLLAFTMIGSDVPNPDPDSPLPGGHCSGNTVAVDFSGSAWEKSRGIIYAPHTVISWTMSESYFEGGIIGYAINFGGSYHEIHYEPDWIPPVPPTGEFTE